MAVFFVVSDILPLNNSLNVTATATITATFNAVVDSGTVSAASLTVRGLQSGIYGGSYSFPAADTARFDPANNFKAGEVVMVNASSQISSADGTALTPYAWQFTVDARSGDGHGLTWSEHPVNGNFNGVTSVYAADVDGDGDLDVLGAAEFADDITWWENVDQAGPGSGNGTAWSKHTVDDNFNGAKSVYAADVDGDGDLDVLGAAYYANDITWWENVDQAGPGSGNGTAWSEHPVDANFSGAESVYAADVDGDGDLDVLGVADGADDLIWWENTAGSGTAWSKHTVDANFNGGTSVHAADVDGDGDLDILGTAYFTNDLTWWENTNGNGTDWSEHTVDANFYGARSVYAADVDGDGDLDVLGAATNADDITWWENVDQFGSGSGSGTTWSKHTVDASFSGARSVYAADVDGDGDLDVLGAAYSTDDITWWENADGNGTAWSKFMVDGNFNGARSVYAADVDGDGDLDVLGAAYSADDITVWLNEPPADLQIGKSVNPSTAEPGDTVTYTLTFSNTGNSTATGVVITDIIPSELSAISYQPSAISITPIGSINYVWQVEDLSPGEGGLITISGVLSNPSGGVFTNTATIATTFIETDTNNNTAQVGLTVNAADLALSK